MLVTSMMLRGVGNQQLDTNRIDDRIGMFLTVLVIFVIKIHYLFTLMTGTHIKRCHQDRNFVPILLKLLPTLNRQPTFSVKKLLSEFYKHMEKAFFLLMDFE